LIIEYDLHITYECGDSKSNNFGAKKMNFEEHEKKVERLEKIELPSKRSRGVENVKIQEKMDDFIKRGGKTGSKVRNENRNVTNGVFGAVNVAVGSKKRYINRSPRPIVIDDDLDADLRDILEKSKYDK
jgi:hypothetical protein